MVGSFIRSFLYWAIITLVSVSLVFTSPVKRSTADFSGPCHTLSEEGPTISRPLNVSLTDLKARTLGLKEKAQLMQEYIADRFQYDGVWVDQLNNMNWMGEEEMHVTDEQIEAALSEPIEALKSHMVLLEEHLMYVSQTHTVGAMYTKKSEAETREKLATFETELRSCICSLKIALLSAGYDENSTISTDVLDPNFVSHSSPLINATYRTYVVMQDDVQLMEFLNTIYNEVQLSLGYAEA